MIETASATIRQPYEQIADHLVAEIRAGERPAGARLPAERELAATLGVGRAVVREALGWLQVEGLVETRRGAGSFVALDVAERLDAFEPADHGQASPSALLQARAVFEPEVAALAAAAVGRTSPAPPAGAAATPTPGAEAAPGHDETLARLLVEMETNLDPDDPEQRRRWSDADRRFHRNVAALSGNPVVAAMADAIERAMDEPLWRRLRDDSVATPGRTTLQLAEHRLIAAAVLDGDAEAAREQAARHIDRVRRFMAPDTDPEPTP